MLLGDITITVKSGSFIASLTKLNAVKLLPCPASATKTIPKCCLMSAKIAESELSL